MAVESLAWPAEPSLTDGDDAENYTLGGQFYVLADTPCEGARWRVPDSVANPTGTGTHAIALWNANTEVRLAYKEFVPTPGVYQDIFFDAPVTVVVGQEYVITVHTRHYVYRLPAPTSGWAVVTPSGNCSHERSRLTATGTPTVFPGGTFNAWYYVAPLLTVGGPDPEPGPAGLPVPVALGTPELGVALLPEPAGLAVPVSLGAPDVAPAAQPEPAGQAIGIALGLPRVLDLITPPGVAIPLALGEPGVGLAVAPLPDGLAVPLTLGTPSVAELVSPDGVAVPVGLGVPGVGVAAAAGPEGVALPLVLGTPILEAAAVLPGSVVVPVTLGAPASGPTVPVLHLPILSGTAAVRPGPSGTATLSGLSGTATLI